MKKIQFLIVSILFILALVFASKIETSYKRNAKVINVVFDEITVLDESGNLWMFYDTNFKKGDEVILIMNNNHTDTDLSDDTIKKYYKKQLTN